MLFGVPGMVVWPAECEAWEADEWWVAGVVGVRVGMESVT